MLKRPDLVQLQHPSNLIINAGNSQEPDYQMLNFQELEPGNTLLHVMDRHSKVYDGVYAHGIFLTSDKDHYLSGFSIKLPDYSLKTIDGIVVVGEEGARAIDQHVPKPEVTTQLLREGFDLYFPGLLELSIEGTYKAFIGMRKFVEPGTDNEPIIWTFSAKSIHSQTNPPGGQRHSQL